MNLTQQIREKKVEALLDTTICQQMSVKIHLEQSNTLYILDKKIKKVMNDLSPQSCSKYLSSIV